MYRIVNISKLRDKLLNIIHVAGNRLVAAIDNLAPE